MATLITSNEILFTNFRHLNFTKEKEIPQKIVQNQLTLNATRQRIIQDHHHQRDVNKIDMMIAHLPRKLFLENQASLVVLVLEAINVKIV